VLDGLDAVGGGITVAEDIKLELVASLKTAQEAKVLNDQIKNGLNQGLAVLALLAGNDRD